jgi:hypothetical protein
MCGDYRDRSQRSQPRRSLISIITYTSLRPDPSKDWPARSSRIEPGSIQDILHRRDSQNVGLAPFLNRMDNEMRCNHFCFHWAMVFHVKSQFTC